MRALAGAADNMVLPILPCIETQRFVAGLRIFPAGQGFIFFAARKLSIEECSEKGVVDCLLYFRPQLLEEGGRHRRRTRPETIGRIGL